MTAGTGFTGFRPAAFAFFRGLRDNNDPNWFKPRKAVYETEVLAPFRALIAAVTAALAEAGIPLAGDPARSIFRIYRDVRFSPDKRLYKTHAGAVLTRSGEKRDPGLLYLHLEPGASMMAAGFWHPEPPLLTRLRRAIVSDPDRFVAIAERLDAAGYPISTDEALTRLPRGFEAAKAPPSRIMSAGNPSPRMPRCGTGTCNRRHSSTLSSISPAPYGRSSNGGGRRPRTICPLSSSRCRRGLCRRPISRSAIRAN